MPDANAFQDRRTFIRVALPVHDTNNWCTLRTGTGDSATALIMDINIEGCRLAVNKGAESNCLCTLTAGDHLEFCDCGLERWGKGLCGMQAQVVWVDGGEIGCRFDKTLEGRMFAQSSTA